MEGSFRRLSDAELARLSNEELIAYIAAAREAADLEAAKRASGILAFGYEPQIACWVRAKVPPADLEDVVSAVFESVIRSLYDSKSVGQFVAWLRTITKRRIADYYRALEGKPPLGPSLDADPEDGGIDPGLEEQGYASMEVRAAAAQQLAERNPIHQDVIRLYGPSVLGYMDLSAAETVAKLAELHPSEPMSEANVHKIWSRFQSDLQDELGLGGFG